MPLLLLTRLPFGCCLQIKPHPHFMLFATQNPPGAYGGRKVRTLSLALPARAAECSAVDANFFYYGQ